MGRRSAICIALILTLPASARVARAEQWFGGGLAMSVWGRAPSFGPAASAGVRLLDHPWVAVEVASVQTLRFMPTFTGKDQGNADVSGSRWFYNGTLELHAVVPRDARIRLRFGLYVGAAWFHQHATLVNHAYDIDRDYSSALWRFDAGLTVAVEVRMNRCTSIEAALWLTARPDDFDGPFQHRAALSVLHRF